MPGTRLVLSIYLLGEQVFYNPKQLPVSQVKFFPLKESKWGAGKLSCGGRGGGIFKEQTNLLNCGIRNQEDNLPVSPRP